MNLFFRLLGVIITALFRKQDTDLLGTTKLNFRVWLTDQDMFMHLTNSRYLSFSDLGTINYIVRIGYMSVFRDRGWTPVICAQTMNVSRMLKTPQDFEVHTRLTGWDDTYIGLQHSFIRKGKSHAEVYVIARLAGRDGSRPTPHDLVAAGGKTEKSPPLPKPFLELIEKAEAARHKKVPINRLEPAQ